MNALQGLNEIIRCEKKRHGHTIVGDEPENLDQFEPIIDEIMGGAKYYTVDDDGPQQVEDEALGFDMGTVSPYLSAFASGFGGDDKKKGDAEAEKAKNEAAIAKAQAEQAAASSRTTLFVVLGLIAASVVGGGIFLATRKK